MNATVQIFLSYAREAEERVEYLYQKLSDAGFKPWMDKKDILPGEIWKSSIQRATQRSDFFLACLSANSVNKRGFLQKEIKDALNIWQEKLEDDIYLIPVRLEDCEVPEGLRDFHWVNLFEEDGWTRLVKAIQAGMERKGEVVKPIPTPFEPYQVPEKLSLGTDIATLEEGPKRVQPSSLSRITAPILKRIDVLILFVIILIVGIFLNQFLCRPKNIFPQFGRGVLRNNAANISHMEHDLMPWEENCLENVKNVLVIDTHLEEDGYAVVNFHKLSFFTTDLGRQLLLRIAITTNDPNFEVGMWDGRTTIFFNCHVQNIDQVSDFLINIDDESLTKKGVTFQPQHTQGFSVGFANDAGTKPGRHHMEVYGIISGDSFPNTSQTCQCFLRRGSSK